MSDPLEDITPTENPISLARTMERKARDEDVVAGFYLLVHKNGDVSFNGAGYRRSDLLWGLAKMQRKILDE